MQLDHPIYALCYATNEQTTVNKTQLNKKYINNIIGIIRCSVLKDP